MVKKTHISDPLECKPTKEVLETAKGAVQKNEEAELKLLCICLLRVHLLIACAPVCIIKIWSGGG